MELTFKEDTHEYFLDKIKIPGVNEVIQYAGLKDFSMVKKHDLEYAQQRGTAVHIACDLWDEGTLDESILDDIIKPYLEGWKKFRSDFNPEIVHNELMVHSEKYMFAGKLDNIFKIDGKYALVDKKTSKIADIATNLQLAGYEVALEEIMPEIDIFEGFGVYLRDNGTYKISGSIRKQDKEAFLAMVKSYWWKRNNGYIKVV